MFKNWQMYFSEVITGQRRGISAFLLRGVLYVLSRGYQAIVGWRNWAFDKGYFRRYYPPVPLVISIGNIVVGGTGKTPVTLMIANEFYPDTPLAILSRGYKSPAEKLSKPVILCKGEGPLFPAAYSGDEPFLLAQRLPKAHIIVGKNRYAASNMASLAGAQVILLDDGMQHRCLERDLEVIVVNAQDAFGQGYFLPRGFLREHLNALSRADLVIINRVNDAEHCDSIQKQLQKYTKAPTVGTQVAVQGIFDNQGNTLSLKDKKVGIFCGLANPLQFQQTVESQGAKIVAQKFTSDHDTLAPHTLENFAQHCSQLGAEHLICTEKDYVKLSEEAKNSLPITWLQMRLEIISGENHWREFITKAKSDLARRI